MFERLGVSNGRYSDELRKVSVLGGMAPLLFWTIGGAVFVSLYYGLPALNISAIGALSITGGSVAIAAAAAIFFSLCFLHAFYDGPKELSAAMFLRYTKLTAIEIPSSVTSFNRDFRRLYDNPCLSEIICAPNQFALVPKSDLWLNDIKLKIRVDGSEDVECEWNGDDSPKIVCSMDQFCVLAAFDMSFRGVKVKIHVEGSSKDIEVEWGDSACTIACLPDQVPLLKEFDFRLAGVKVVIHDGVTSIPTGLFQHTDVVSVELPESVTCIEQNAFQDCDQLEKVIGPGVEQVGVMAFSGCVRLQSIEMPVLKKVGMTSFGKCKRLSKLVAPNLEEVASYAFKRCVRLQYFYAPKARSYGRRVFDKCWNLEVFELPDGCTVGENIFANCQSLRVLCCSDDVAQQVRDGNQLGLHDNPHVLGRVAFINPASSTMSLWVTGRGQQRFIDPRFIRQLPSSIQSVVRAWMCDQMAAGVVNAIETAQTVMHIAERLFGPVVCREGGDSNAVALPSMPLEMWRFILSFVCPSNVNTQDATAFTSLFIALRQLPAIEGGGARAASRPTPPG